MIVQCDHCSSRYNDQTINHCPMCKRTKEEVAAENKQIEAEKDSRTPFVDSRQDIIYTFRHKAKKKITKSASY